MWFPDPEALEMNLTLGSSCPTYQPLSSRRDALPWALMWIGSVHSDRIIVRAGAYFGLQPLQSTSLPDLGAIGPAKCAGFATAGKANNANNPTIAMTASADALPQLMTLTEGEPNLNREPGQPRAAGARSA